ncbi:MAG TPA: DUF222 domain-containing protein [Mycobacteriales bacterium]|nr:DUF222 domain-containing protein [Mycobacteriales bacterium]
MTAVDAALAEDPLITDPARVIADLDELLAVRTRLDALIVSRLRVAEQLDATSTLCGRSTRSWLTEDHLMSGASVGRLYRLQKHLPFFPHVDAAFRAATISTQHAAAVVSALLSLPPSVRPTLEPLLVAVAGEETPSGVAGMVEDLLSAVRFEKESDVRRERRYTQRGVDVTATSREQSALSGTLTAHVAEVLVLALRAAAATCEADDRTPRQRMHDEVLDLGRTHRHFSAASRRAAWIRDGGCCAFPRCRRKVVELHHIIWWSHGGRSDLDNAVWLSAYHHWLVHEGGWSLRRNADGGYTFSNPCGVERIRHLSAA